MAENDIRKYYLFALKAATDITATIIVPGLLAVLLRATYDQLAFAQLVFYISLLVVFVLSMILVVKKIQRYGEEYKKLIQAEPPRAGSGPSS